MKVLDSLLCVDKCLDNLSFELPSHMEDTCSVKCLHPTRAWKCGKVTCKSDGVLSDRLFFSFRAAEEWCKVNAYPFDWIEERDLPCGKCAMCQIRKRKDMTVRLSQECLMHDECCFITLTYNDEHIPVTDWRSLDDGSKSIDFGFGELPEATLLPSDIQRFMKRLRRWLEYVPKRPRSDGLIRDHRKGIRYFCVGEYGSNTHRPHYHLIIFGWKPSDLIVHHYKCGTYYYRSPQIEHLWTHCPDGYNSRESLGFSLVEDVHPTTAKYCARYVTKKFSRLDNTDPFSSCVVPEFILSSRKGGGIGAPWFDKYGVDACLRGFVGVKSKYGVSKYSIPRYFKMRLRKYHLSVWLHLRDQSLLFFKSHKGFTVTDLLREVDYAYNQYKHEKESEVL